MRQVLSNLLTNAVRYGRSDTAIHVVLKGEPSRVVLEVRNEGVAIDPATFDLLFDRGEQRVVDGEGEGEGLGMGLYISREIARAHRGRIEATSDAGGTVFTVSLARAQVAPINPAGCSGSS